TPRPAAEDAPTTRGPPVSRAPSPGVRSLEDERAIGADTAHPDRVVERDRGCVLGANEEGERGGPREQEAAEIGEPALPVAIAAHGRVDPHLLELHGAVGPRRGLGLEEDRAVLLPQPAPPLFDLGHRAPLEEG